MAEFESVNDPAGDNAAGRFEKGGQS